MADQDSRHSDMMTQILRHLTSSPYDVNVKGNIFRRTIYPPGVVVIALILPELQCRWEVGGGGKSVPLTPVVEDTNSPV